jgi:putative FmdB family regulatory protein
MPIYEYRCPDCGHEFERLQRMSDDPAKDCPECSGDQVKKLISRTSFVLKGGGWYKDHYGLKGGSSDNASSTSKGSSSGSGKSTTKDAPAAAAPASTPSKPSTSSSSDS